MHAESLPTAVGLFPLHTVLLPGAALGLRVFEPRYLDLVRECGRDGSGFGVCLILDGEEVGAPATPAAFGTEARIEDFGTGDDGLLTLRVRGARRFHVQRTRVRDNGLMVAEVEWCEPDPRRRAAARARAAGDCCCERILDRSAASTRKAPPARFDDAAWVGWRLAELLPLQRLAAPGAAAAGRSARAPGQRCWRWLP